MATKTKISRILTAKLSLKPLFLYATVIIGGAALVGGTLLANPGQFNRKAPTTVAQTPQTTPTPKPNPKPAPAPTPAPTPPKPPAPKPKSVGTTSAKPAPVVTPAPNSNVSSLTPTGTGDSSGGSSGTSTPQQTQGYTSTNWSGYLAAGKTFTGVSGEWTVPNVSGNGSTTSADASWIGIGGVTSQDLIQTGTLNSVSRSGVVSRAAFYELLPAPATIIPDIAVSPGDVMTAAINQTSPGQWNITITNTTKNQTFSINVSYASSYSTAEWIQEAPSTVGGSLIPLDLFGTVSFRSSLATAGGTSFNLTALNAQPVTMVNASTGNPVATPSQISGGTNFTVTRN